MVFNDPSSLSCRCTNPDTAHDARRCVVFPPSRVDGTGGAALDPPPRCVRPRRVLCRQPDERESKPDHVGCKCGNRSHAVTSQYGAGDWRVCLGAFFFASSCKRDHRQCGLQSCVADRETLADPSSWMTTALSFHCTMLATSTGHVHVHVHVADESTRIPLQRFNVVWPRTGYTHGTPCPTNYTRQ